MSREAMRSRSPENECRPDGTNDPLWAGVPSRGAETRYPVSQAMQDVLGPAEAGHYLRVAGPAESRTLRTQETMHELMDACGAGCLAKRCGLGRQRTSAALMARTFRSRWACRAAERRREIRCRTRCRTSWVRLKPETTYVLPQAGRRGASLRSCSRDPPCCAQQCRTPFHGRPTSG